MGAGARRVHEKGGTRPRYREDVQLDLDVVRSNFPAFSRPINDGQSFFENAGGSFACRQTIDALTEYYTDLKVQPYGEFESWARAGALMDRSRARWAVIVFSVFEYSRVG